MFVFIFILNIKHVTYLLIIKINKENQINKNMWLFNKLHIHTN